MLNTFIPFHFLAIFPHSVLIFRVLKPFLIVSNLVLNESASFSLNQIKNQTQQKLGSQLLPCIIQVYYEQ